MSSRSNLQVLVLGPQVLEPEVLESNIDLTIQHRTVLIIFPLILQTLIITQILFIGLRKTFGDLT